MWPVHNGGQSVGHIEQMSIPSGPLIEGYMVAITTQLSLLSTRVSFLFQNEALP